VKRPEGEGSAIARPALSECVETCRDASAMLPGFKRACESSLSDFSQNPLGSMLREYAPDRIRTCNPQIRSHEPAQTPKTSDDLPEKKSGNGS
jgi:hypothetical protein